MTLYWGSYGTSYYPISTPATVEVPPGNCLPPDLESAGTRTHYRGDGSQPARMGGPHHTTRSNPMLRPIPRPKLNTLGMYSLSQGTMLPYFSFDLGSVQKIHGAMLARVELDRCGDVFTWLKATATLRGGGGGLQNVVPGVYHPPLAPVHLPDDVYRYMIGKVCSELPALAAAADPTAAETLGVLAGALRALAGKAAGG